TAKLPTPGRLFACSLFPIGLISYWIESSSGVGATSTRGNAFALSTDAGGRDRSSLREKRKIKILLEKTPSFQPRLPNRSKRLSR
ncbi:MAG: hypothetical protein WBF52_11975, partial [Geitlerinemataceae cyanobacterium]